jgi:hypothetical protein
MVDRASRRLGPKASPNRLPFLAPLDELADQLLTHPPNAIGSDSFRPQASVRACDVGHTVAAIFRISFPLETSKSIPTGSNPSKRCLTNREIVTPSDRWLALEW